MFNLGSAVGYLVLNAQQVIQGVNTAIGAIRRLPQATTAAFGQMTDTYKKNFFALRDVGAAFTAVSGAIGFGFEQAIKSAVSWESAMAGVARTTTDTNDTLEVQRQKLKAINDSLLELSTRKPIPAGDLAAIAEEAGALGLRGQTLVKFTGVVADLAATTNLSSDEATAALARIGTIMQGTEADFDRMGSTVLQLGRDFPATETEIVNMAKRIAGTGKVVGFTTDQILAYAAAFASVGVREEQGGSAISRTLVDIQKAVSDGGDDLQKFAAIAGVSVERFSQLFKEDAAGATALFITGLGRAQKAGVDVLAVLNNLGITELRQRDAILRMAASGDLLNNALQVGAQAWDENSALAEIAAQRYNTAEAQIQLLKNQIFIFANAIGQELLPALKFVVSVFKDFMSAFNAAPGPLKVVFAILVAMAGTIFALAAAFVFLGPRIAQASAALKDLAASSAAAATGLTVLKAATGIIGVALTIAGVAMYLLGQKASSTDQKVAAFEQSVNSLAGALAKVNTDGGKSVKTWVAQSLAASGAQEALAEMGITAEDVYNLVASPPGSDKAVAIWGKFGKAVQKNGFEVDKNGKRLDKYTPKAQKAYDFISNLAHITENATYTQQQNASAMHQLGLMTEEEAAAAQAASDASKELTEKINKQNKATVDLIEAQMSARRAQSDLIDAKEKATEAADKLAHKDEYLAQQELAVQAAHLAVLAAQDKLKKAEDDLAHAREKAAQAVADAQIDYQDAVENQYQANQRVLELQDELNKAMAGPSQKEILEATHSLTDAYNKLQHAQLGVEDAQWQLNYLMAEGASDRDIQDAQLALRDALAARDDATDDLKDKQGKLNDLMKGPDQKKIIDLEHQLEAAKRGVIKATRETQDAETALTAARDALAADTAYKEAEQALLDVRKGIIDAQLNEQEETRKLQELQNGKLEKDYRDTLLDLEDANYRVATANVEVQKQTALSKGLTFDSAQEVNALRDQLRLLAGEADGPIASSLNGLANNLNGVALPRTVTIGADISSAEAEINNLTTQTQENTDKQRGFWEALWDDVGNWAGNTYNFIGDIFGGIGGFFGGIFKAFDPRNWDFTPGGHAKGGLFNREHLAWISEGNKPELILPLSDMTRSWQLLVDSGLAERFGLGSAEGMMFTDRMAPVAGISSGSTTHYDGDTNNFYQVMADPAQIAAAAGWKKRIRAR